MRGRPSGPGAAPSSNASASAGGKRDEVGMEVRGDDGGRRKGGRGGGRGEVRDSSLLFWLQVIGVVAGITGVLTFLFSNMKHKANKATSLDSDSSIMRRATVEVNRLVFCLRFARRFACTLPVCAHTTPTGRIFCRRYLIRGGMEGGEEKDARKLNDVTPMQVVKDG